VLSWKGIARYCAFKYNYAVWFLNLFPQITDVYDIVKKLDWLDKTKKKKSWSRLISWGCNILDIDNNIYPLAVGCRRIEAVCSKRTSDNAIIYGGFTLARSGQAWNILYSSIESGNYTNGGDVNIYTNRSITSSTYIQFGMIVYFTPGSRSFSKVVFRYNNHGNLPVVKAELTAPDSHGNSLGIFTVQYHSSKYQV
jgi:hypothetical protein